MFLAQYNEQTYPLPNNTGRAWTYIWRQRPGPPTLCLVPEMPADHGWQAEVV